MQATATMSEHRTASLDLFCPYIRARRSDDPHELRALSLSDCEPIRRCVAANPYTPADVVEELALDWNPDVRAAVASNPRATYKVIHSLAKDSEKEVRLAVARGLDRYLDILQQLASDTHRDVAKVARQALHMVATSKGIAGRYNVLSLPADAADNQKKSA
jgi:hypothetical protein